MDLHSGARTCPASRALLVSRVTEQRWTVSAAAQAVGISRVTAHKWLARGREGALQDRSSRPRRSPNRTPPWWEDMVVMLRRTGMTGPKIAHDLKLPTATVARILARNGLRRLRDLEPREPVERYEHRRPGDLIHLDVKKLGRIVRWAIASTETAPGRHEERAGSTCTSRSMIDRVSPTSRPFATRPPPRRPASCAGRSPGIEPWEYVCAAS